jgi:hypothetical protein
MELKRRLSLVVAIMSVALGSGHLVQNVLGKPASLASAEAQPMDITLVAAGPEKTLPELPVANVVLSTPSFAEIPADEAPSLFTLPDDPVVQADFGTQVPGNNVAADQCPVTLDALAEPAAMIGLTLLAPCRTNERVVLRHAGLAVTGKTSGTGTLFVSLPAFTSDATVSVRFRDGETVTASLDVPEAKTLRRFGVQWMGDDAFQLNAFESGADYGEFGHVSAADPRIEMVASPKLGGFLSVLGDDQVELPMLAEVYTYPAESDAPVRIVVEAAITKGTCGREILGETLADLAGDVTITELTLAMPDCNAVGDILVLKNLDPDLKIASAN